MRIESPWRRGSAVKSRRFGNRWLLRFASGEDVLDGLVSHLERERIGLSFVSAAGGLRSARLAYWDAHSRSYREQVFEEQFEVLSLQGNTSIKDGRPFPHLHVGLGTAAFQTCGGHLKAGVVHPTLELWLDSQETRVERHKDRATGLDLLDLG
jgi:uncharacterized protein